jgi:hypothetical protein
MSHGHGPGRWEATSPKWIRTTWIKSLSDQTGFININNVRAGDPEVERRVIEDVASYDE